MEASTVDVTRPLDIQRYLSCPTDRVDDFCDKLRQRRIEASLDAAKATAELMRQLVTSQRLPDPQSLLAEVKSVGLRIQAAKPIGKSLGRRVVVQLTSVGHCYQGRGKGSLRN